MKVRLNEELNTTCTLHVYKFFVFFFVNFEKNDILQVFASRKRDLSETTRVFNDDGDDLKSHLAEVVLHRTETKLESL